MKLTLRPEWRPRPFTSFLGFLDIKTGVTVALLFALLNKVAGVYGLVAVLTGAGGSMAQLSMYIYSVIALAALVWGLQAISQEDAKNTLYFAHLFFADHVVSTAWTVFFAVVWWLYTPHDGRRQANSAAQLELMSSGTSHNMTQQERTAAAMSIWHKEKGIATAVIVAGWLVKIYFALLMYSYAIHLRKGSYRSLPHSRASAASAYANATSLTSMADDDDDVEDFYRLPVRTPASAHSHPQVPGGGSSISSFADFVSAPGRSRRSAPKGHVKSGLNPTSGKNDAPADDVDEVLFDDDEVVSGLSSKYGTDDSGSGSGSGRGDSPDGDRPGGIGYQSHGLKPRV